MFCNKCGAKLADDSAFCSSCGAPVQRVSAQPQQSYQQPSYQQPSYQQQSYQQPSYQQPSYQQQSYQAPQQSLQQQGMGWYKFIINFMLFFSAILNFAYGILYVTGEIYESVSDGDVPADLVYAFFPEMQTADIIFGILSIAVAAFAIYTRIRLKNFCKNGPTCLYVLYIAALVISTIYIAVASSVIGESAADASTITSIVVSVTMLIININYFGKRKHMFVNE